MSYSTHFHHFTIDRRIDATPALTFLAFSSQEHKSQWFAGPSGWTQLDRHFDFREGGSECVEGRFPDSGKTSLFRCQYHNIVPDQRIIYSYDMFVNGERISVSLVTIEFVPDGNGTHLKFTEQIVHLDGYPTPEDREVGSRFLIEKVATYVEELKTPAS